MNGWIVIGIVFAATFLLLLFPLRKGFCKLGWQYGSFSALVFVLICLEISVIMASGALSCLHNILFGIGMCTATMLLLWMLTKWHERNESLHAAVIVLGIVHVACVMTVVSLPNINLYLKLIANIVYLALPALAVYEISEGKKNAAG
ncbi:hypothetical protein NEILACOT_05050 [Neisseria lactamica ATCC 23970]|uniref:Uncharacterized protein n=2 Tax=Neisseria lactamica TaxID=486 RepID=D0WBX2_NEILA|nr:hypothetical protein [Neisseria lactamica]EEZ74899.1 hypothetical protein NEILACOT_05050 [Neisseria lactamica ATCC 23970]KFJ35462.1 putative membrane protein [Neisseria lactamica ATCC 23970]SUA18201.1 Uncharacterised protein [Neisseria lactamica]VTQ49200.1 Uncharacterised protein [Neisseria lactamica]